MSRRLDGIYSKIVRALDDLQTLYDEGTNFLGDDPYSVRFEHYMDEHSGEHRVRALLVIIRQHAAGVSPRVVGFERGS